MYPRVTGERKACQYRGQLISDKNNPSAVTVTLRPIEQGALESTPLPLLQNSTV